ncbi:MULTISPECIES: acetoacetate decarboxylase family protein [unclassified Natrinema]|uniref:acetoacetate decarboxylase family protein n=1 Tax=unclassified Natrinema TaxID=2622230 RepID=UPI00026D475C|nr:MULTISPECIES: acetoacetate decarboxylase family protein [unclassified Natrinema]AFO57708.1 acetoacetate decarboxylase [Natrinema sp. J7-2]
MTTADDRPRWRLSTGHVVSLPLELSFAMGGVTVPARRGRLEAALPDGLSALALAPGVGCVSLVGIQYHRVGGGDRDGTALEPYDEFAVIVPAIRGSRTTRLLAQLAGSELGGYVHWLPVTTAPAVALGREIWGYPKELAAITVTDGPDGIRTVVDGDRYGDAPIRLEVARPRLEPRARDWTLTSYTTKDGALVRTTARIRGDVAIGSGVGTRLSVPSALARDLGLWRRPLARLYGSNVRARLFAGERLAE